MKKVFLHIIPVLLIVMGSMDLFAQTRIITGTVKDSNGDAIIGASILVKGSTVGTYSDANGGYSLAITSDAKILIFRYLGMKTQEITLGSSNNLEIKMEDDVLGLDEVVVTALGISSEKKGLGYSVQEISGNDVTKGSQTNVINDLSGKFAGITVNSSSGAPGASSNIIIRGSTSITGNNQPLMIIDGVPYDNGQTYSGDPNNLGNNLLDGVGYSNRGIDINPDDIASVSVLKGPAASALYGTRANHGVIIITTKKGDGGKGKGMHVSYNVSLSLDKVNKLPELQNKYSQGLDGIYHGPLSGSGGRKYSWGALIDTAVDDSGKALQVYDNAGSFFETGKSWNHALSLSGGSNNSNYYFSFSNVNQKGIIPLSDFGRTSLRISGETNLSKIFKTSGSVSYSKSGGTRIQQGSNTSGLMLGLLRTPPTFDNSNGATDATDSTAYENPDGTQRNYRGGIGYDNPYWTINKNKFVDDVNRVSGYASITALPASWIDITYKIGTDFYSDRRKQVFAIHSAANPAGQIQEDQHFHREVNSDLLVTLNHKFSDDFKGSLLLGNNLNARYDQQFYAQGDGLVITDFYNLSNAAAVNTKESHYITRNLAYYSQIKVEYGGMLYLDLTGRMEKASTFNAGTKGFFYPAANLGFVFTEPLGLSTNKIFPYGKLRLSYAQVGGEPPAYSTQTTYNQTFYTDGYISPSGITFPYNGIPGFTYGDTRGNPDLKPENTSSFETGLELKFLQNRLGVDFTYYSSNSKDQILGVPTAPSIGFNAEIINAGEISNKGVELQLNGTPVKTKNFDWEIGVNWAKNKNLVVSLPDGIDQILIGANFGDPIIAAVVGQPYGIIYGTQWIVDSTTGKTLIDGSGSPNPDSADYNPAYGFPMMDNSSLYVIGDPNPKWTGSISNTLTFKGISLFAQVDVKHGGQIWNGTRGALNFFGMSKETEGRDGAATAFDGESGYLDGDGNIVVTNATNDIKVPRDENWYFNGPGSGFTGPSSPYIENSGYVRLRTLALGYSLPANVLGKTPFGSVDISFTAKNLWLKTKYTGIDPETSLTGADNAQGFDYFNMPNTKSWVFALRLTL